MEDIIEKFSQSLREYNQEIQRGYQVSFSSGIVEFNPEVHDTIEELLADGDALMYKSKELKR